MFLFNIPAISPVPSPSPPAFVVVLSRSSLNHQFLLNSNRQKKYIIYVSRERYICCPDNFWVRSDIVRSWFVVFLQFVYFPRADAILRLCCPFCFVFFNISFIDRIYCTCSFFAICCVGEFHCEFCDRGECKSKIE